eukprot:3318374-Rhodomonas_salina.1
MRQRRLLDRRLPQEPARVPAVCAEPDARSLMLVRAASVGCHAVTPSCKHHRMARAARARRDENRQPARKLTMRRIQKDVIVG